MKPNHAIPPSLDKLLQRENIRVTGNREIPNATQYDLARSSDTAKLNVYHTGKVSTGGEASRLREVLEGWRTSSGRGKVGSSKATTKPEARQSGPLLEGTPRLGIDEAGKGDYFGPIVCAGVRISGIEAAQNLKEIGVRDSKDLSLAQVRRMAERIPEAIGDGNVHIVSLTPREYEERRSAAGNVNKLLGEVDAGIIRKLAVEVEVVVVDQFAPAARSYVASSVPGACVWRFGRGRKMMRRLRRLLLWRGLGSLTRWIGCRRRLGLSCRSGPRMWWGLGGGSMLREGWRDCGISLR